MIRCLLIVLLVCCGLLRAEPPQSPLSDAKDARQRKLAVTTIEDEHLIADKYELREGALVVASPAAHTLPLTEIQKVEWVDSTAGLNVLWFGQDGEDLVGVGNLDSANGIQDCHVRVLGLPAGKTLKQVSVVRRSPAHVWKLDAKKSPHWKIALQQASGPSTADLYFEPPTVDAFGGDLEIVLAFQDGAVAKTSVTADTHTSDQLKTERVGADGQSIKSPPVTLHLEGGEVVNGRLVAMSEESLTLETLWATTLEIPLLQIRGILSKAAKPEVVARYEKARLQPGSDDVALLRARDESLAEVTGHVQSMKDGQIQFHYDGEARGIKADRLLALVFAAHPPKRAKATPYQVLRFMSGDSFSGEWLALGERSLSFRTAWGQSLEIPTVQIKEISGRNGRLVYLSDLEPTTVEHVPYFGRIAPYQRDHSLSGEPLKIDGKPYSKGLAVHARTVLTYDLDGAFASFKSLVGFDDESEDRGRIACRILADGKELFSQSDLRGNHEPQPIDVPIRGARQLTLEVDFGQEEDVGDRVIWAMPRLYRDDSPKTPN